MSLVHGGLKCVGVTVILESRSAIESSLRLSLEVHFVCWHLRSHVVLLETSLHVLVELRGTVEAAGRVGMREGGLHVLLSVMAR